MSWFIYVLLLTIFVIYLFTLVVIILEKRNPSKTVAWVIVVTFLPVIGFISYLMVGQNFRKRRKFRRKELEDFGELALLIDQQAVTNEPEQMLATDTNRRRLVNLIYKNSQAPFTVKNHITVLTNGVETFHALLQALRTATHHIHMQYYIWRDDALGQDIARILKEKARAGVEVRVIYDAVGSWRLKKSYIADLQAAGVQVYPFLPVALPLATSKVNYRNHRKIVVVDGKVAFTGGLNIGDEYLGKDTRMGFWRDTHLMLRGDAVYPLQAIFFMDWAFVKDDTHHWLHSGAYFPAHAIEEKHFVQIASSGPDSDWEAILQAYYTAIASATHSVYITTPYFIPDDSILMAIKTAALSGIDVKLIIPARPDHKIVFWATMSYVEELLEAGVKVYQYEKGFVHAKVLIVDGVVASLGTANMDLRSFFYNFEVNALIYDKETVTRLKADFSEDLRHCREVTLAEMYGRPLRRKLIESSARLFSPLL